MKKFSVILLLTLTGCFTRPVNVSIIPARPVVVPLYSGIEHFDVLDAETYNFRGGQPKTLKDFQYLQKAGVEWILKLNTDSEGSDAEAEILGIHVVKIPITFEQQILGPIPVKEIKDFFIQHNMHVYVHCEHGQDRTGLACMIYNIDINAMPKEEAIQDMLSHGFHKILHGLWKSAEDYNINTVQ